MSAKMKKKQKLGEPIKSLGNNPYIRRIAQDKDLRNGILSAISSSRSAYQSLSSSKKPPAKAVLKDKQVKRELKQVLDSLKDVSEQLKSAPAKQKKHGAGRKITLVLLTFGVALAVSEDLRSKVLDLIFGKEEEFQYSSPTDPA